MAHTAEQNRAAAREQREEQERSRWSGNRRRRRRRNRSSNSSWECMSLVIHTNSEAGELSPPRTAPPPTRSASCPDHVSIFSLACVKNENRTGQSDSRTRGTRQKRARGGEGVQADKWTVWLCHNGSFATDSTSHPSHPAPLLDSSSSFNSIRCAMFIVYFSFNFTLFHLRAVCPTIPRTSHTPHSLPHTARTPPSGLCIPCPACGVDSFYALTVCQSHLTVAYISRRPMALNLDKSSVI